MMGVAVVFLGVLFFMLIIGVIGVIAGTVCLIIFYRMGKRGSTAGKVLTVISAVVLAGGILFSLPPLGFFGFVTIQNVLSSSEHTGNIGFEESSYYNTYFPENISIKGARMLKVLRKF